MRVGLQYTGYSKFNGASSNYDGFGRNASDNDTCSDSCGWRCEGAFGWPLRALLPWALALAGWAVPRTRQL